MARPNNFIKNIDKFLGNKIYNLRLARGLSRMGLSEFIGVTHQQLQKYERGINRISVGRLVMIAQALREPISFFYEGLEDFYEGLEDDNDEKTVTQHQRMCLEVSRNFMKIANPKHQDAVHTIIKTLMKAA